MTSKYFEKKTIILRVFFSPEDFILFLVNLPTYPSTTILPFSSNINLSVCFLYVRWPTYLSVPHKTPVQYYIATCLSLLLNCEIPSTLTHEFGSLLVCLYECVRNNVKNSKWNWIRNNFIIPVTVVGHNKLYLQIP